MLDLPIEKAKTMKKYKFAVLALLLILVLIGAGCFKSPKSFYKKVCKAAVPFQEKLDDFYGSAGSDFGYYDDVDECIEESLEKEEEVYEECLYQECLKEEDEDECDDVKKDKGYKGLEKLVDAEDCQETIDEVREFTAEIYTRDGCEDIYGTECADYELTTEAKKYLSSREISEMQDQYDNCMEDIKELCGDLPEKF
ncbi:hypothetical protein AMJ47_01090 [Parcubacteria bacterium DG_72]|nr:MAG: hypothetical protein AMJ47_01090 [Parcubacteria bacterium DG_72]